MICKGRSLRQIKQFFLDGESPTLMKIKVGLYIKNYFSNYDEARTTRKKLKKFEKQNFTVFSVCLFDWLDFSDWSFY